MAVKDQSALITVPGTQQSIEVSAGDHLLTVSYQGLETQTKSFTLKKVKKRSSKCTSRILISSPISTTRRRPRLPHPKSRSRQRTASRRRPRRPQAPRQAGRRRQELVPKPPVIVAPGRNPPASSPRLPRTAPVPRRAQWASYLQQPGELTNKIGMKLRLIPPGTFLMGSTGSNPAVNPKQKPPHKVHISHPYYIGAYEVTRGEFARFVAETGYKTEAEKNGGKAAGVDAKGDMAEKANLSWKKPGFDQTDAHPVVIVSWNDATAFCRWLSERRGKPIGCRKRPNGNTPAAPAR